MIDEMKKTPDSFFVSKPHKTKSHGYRYVVSNRRPNFLQAQRHYFKTLAEAENFIQKELEIQKSAAKLVQTAKDILAYRSAARNALNIEMTLKEVADAYLELQLKLERLGERKTVHEAMNEYFAWRKSNDVSIRLPQVVKEYLEKYALKHPGKPINSCKYQLTRFAETLGDIPLVQVTPAKLEHYITHMENRSNGVARTRPRGQYVSLRTQHVVFRYIHALFSYCKKAGYISRNYANGVILSPLPPYDPKAYTPEDIAFAINLFKDDKYTRLYICMAAFTGIRPAELGRLHWSDVKIADKVIFLSSAKTKTRFRRSVKMPDNLLEWLAEWRDMFGSDELVFPELSHYQWRFLTYFRKHRTVIFDGLRHSCASYLLAMTSNSSVTSEQLGHTTKILKTHYMDLVHKEDAERFFNIKPSNLKEYLNHAN